METNWKRTWPGRGYDMQREGEKGMCLTCLGNSMEMCGWSRELKGEGEKGMAYRVDRGTRCMSY